MSNQSITEILAANVHLLMQNAKESGNLELSTQLGIQKASERAAAKHRCEHLSRKTVAAMLYPQKGRDEKIRKVNRATGIDNLDTLSYLFGVPPWALIHPDINVAIAMHQLDMVKETAAKQKQEASSELAMPSSRQKGNARAPQKTKHVA